MKCLLNLYKSLGQTPLESIERFRELNKKYDKEKMSYAGRLDPMAEGVLLVLVGDKTKKIGDYLKLDKEYEAEILFGIKSDSCDVLGIAEMGENEEINEKALKKKLKMMKGKYEQKIPKYSSYKIKGKPMFYYARSGKKIEDVKKVVKIKGIKIKNIYKISSEKLLKEVLRKIDLVKGDFRQEEIKKRWRKLFNFSNPPNPKFTVAKVIISCSSGTYIRAIADDVGSFYGGGLLLSLKRTRVGEFDVKDSLRLK